MIHYILFNLNKLKDDRPILITRARAKCQVHHKVPLKRHIMPHATHTCVCASSKATCP